MKEFIVVVWEVRKQKQYGDDSHPGVPNHPNAKGFMMMWSCVVEACVVEWTVEGAPAWTVDSRRCRSRMSTRMAVE